MNESKCKSCGAEIIWAKTHAGKRVPLDKEFENRFYFEPAKGDKVIFARTYKTHFATCPNAAEHRRAKYQEE